jgi:UDP-glucose 4-epimerase
MPLCLVTGGAGFIGSHLVDALIAHGRRVRVLDNLSSGNEENLAQARPHIEFIRGSVADLDAVRAAMGGVEYVFHLAAATSASQSVTDPSVAHRACATGSLYVLLAAREAGVRRVVYAGSCTAYGPTMLRPAREVDLPQPATPYAAAKLAGEEYCCAFSQVYGLETVRLRYFNVFGPRQSLNCWYSQVIPKFIQAMLVGQSPLIVGDGSQSRDYVAVSDVVQANLLAMQAPRVSGRVYNIASGRRTTVKELVTHLNEVLETKIKPIHAKQRTGLVRHSQADISRAQVDLGFCPCVDLDQGLHDLSDYILRQAVSPRLDPPHRTEPVANSLAAPGVPATNDRLPR